MTTGYARRGRTHRLDTMSRIMATTSYDNAVAVICSHNSQRVIAIVDITWTIG